MYYNLVNGIDVYQRACFPLFVSNLDLHFHALMSVNNKYYALRYIWSILCCQKWLPICFKRRTTGH